MTTAADQPNRDRRHRTLRGSRAALLSAGAIVSLSACTVERTIIESAPASTTVAPVATSVPPSTVPPTTPPPTTAPPTKPPPTTAPPTPPPTPQPTVPPPPTQPATTTTTSTTTTTTTTTTPPPTFVVEELDFFKARYESTGGGLNPQNWWGWDTSVPRAQAYTAHGWAIAEAAEVRTMLYSSIQPRSADATVTWDISWNGQLAAAVGADASALATVTVRVYEIFPGTDTAAIGPTVFETVVESDGVGAALQGLAFVRMEGSDQRSVVLPPLDPAKFYRLEAELECSSRVAAAIGLTECQFGRDGEGLTIRDWSIRFDNVPPT